MYPYVYNWKGYMKRGDATHLVNAKTALKNRILNGVIIWVQELTEQHWV